MNAELTAALKAVRASIPHSSFRIHHSQAGQWPAPAGPPVNTYFVPQYGHRASPVFCIGMYTRGCEFHSIIDGIGQCSGKSTAVTSM
jgi:hypothetical protein